MKLRVWIGILAVGILSGISVQAAEISGNQSGTLTLANSPYVVTSSIIVQSGQTLTIQAGVEIRFNSGTAFDIHGTLNAQGTATSKITFTTNATQAPGAWRGIVFWGQASGTLDHTRILYTGDWYAAAITCNDSASPTISNSELAQGSGDGLRLHGTSAPTLTNNAFSHLTWPIRISTWSAMPARAEGNTFNNVTHHGVRHDNPSVPSDAQMAWHTLDNLPYSVGNIAIQSSSKLTLPAGAILKFDDRTALSVYGALEAKGTAPSPIVFTSSTDDIGGDTNGDGAGSLPEPSQWRGIAFWGQASGTLDHTRILYTGDWYEAAITCYDSASPAISNSELARGSGDGLRLHGTSAPALTNNVFSNLTWPIRISTWSAMPARAEGNTFNNVTHHGVRHDSPSVPSDAQMTWHILDNLPYSVGNVTIQSSSKLTLPEGAILKFDDRTALAVYGALDARGTFSSPIVFTSSTDDIGGDTNGDGSGSLPEPGQWRGIAFWGQANGTLDHTRILYTGDWYEAAITCHDSASPAISGSEIAFGSGDGLRLHGTSAPALTNNLFSHLTWPIRISTWSAMPRQMQGSTFLNVAHYGIRHDSPSVPSDAQMAWHILDNLPYSVGNVTIQSGAKLTLPEGAILKFNDRTALAVYGTLDAKGTASSPIVFTSSTDDIGGDTNADGASSLPESGQWRGIAFWGQATGALDHTRILYTGDWYEAAITCNDSASPTISNSELAHISGDGMRLQGTAAPFIGPNILFAHLTGFGVRNSGTSTANAKNNWWGHASGPKHSANAAGTGFEVTDRVDFSPYLSAPPELWQESPAPGLQTVKTQKNTYAPDEPIVVEYADFPGNQQDWITIVAAGSPPDHYGQWFYTGGQQSGTFTFGGYPAGAYEVRAYFNWPDGGFAIQARYAFSVQGEIQPPVAHIRVPEDYAAIQSAINAAQAGQTIRVAAGIYYENIDLKAGVSVIGAGANITIIDGGGSDVVWGADQARISGFTIRNGGDAGIFTYGASPIIDNCIITGNGQGIATNRQAVITNNLITNNEDYGIFAGSNGSPYIANNLIVGNGALANGLTLFQTGGQVINNTFDANGGHGISTSAPSTPLRIDIRNNIATSNGFYGIRGYAFDGQEQTIGYNNAWNNGWDNYHNVAPGTGSISADPLYVNPIQRPAVKPSATRETTKTAMARMQDREQTNASRSARPAPAVRTHAAKTATTTAFDYRLQPGSPSINAGDPASQYADADGSRNDMGAYGGPRPFGIESGTGPIHDPLSLTFTLGERVIEEGVKNAPIAPGTMSFSWTFSEPGMFENAEILSFPDLGDLVSNEVLSADGKTLSGIVDLPTNTTYQIAVVINPDRPQRVFSYYVGTTELPDASVSGTLSGEYVDHFNWWSVNLVNRDPKDLEGQGEEAWLKSIVRGFFWAPGSNHSLNFEIKHVPDGTYYVWAGGEFEQNGETVFVSTYYDANGDGVADAIQIVNGRSITGLDLAPKKEEPPPPVPGEGPVGPIALDLDKALGDQGKRTGLYPRVGETVTIDLVATEGALGLSGFEALLSFDPSQLEYASFSLMDLFAGGVPIETPGTGTIKISAVFFGSTTTAKNAGTLGQFTFKVLPGYTGETYIRITEGAFASGGTPQPLTIGSGGAIVAIGGSEPPPPTPDFDGDGVVGFSDFLGFAQVFGARQGDARYQAKFDLDQNGDIGFSDFLIFAQAFGKPVG